MSDNWTLAEVVLNKSIQVITIFAKNRKGGGYKSDFLAST